MPESSPPSWLLRLLDELGYRVPPHVRPLDAYVDRYGDARYVFEVDYGSGPRRVELLEEDLRTLLPAKETGPRPDPMTDPELARLTPTRGEFGEVWGKSLHPALVRAARRAELRRAASWYRKEEAPEWLLFQIPEGNGVGKSVARSADSRPGSFSGGAGPGLSNGANHAATAGEAFLQSPKAWLTATLEHRPGTLHVKISGRFTPLGGQAKRGEIRRITPGSMRRLASLTRELESQGMVPEFMITTTYPADWRGALGADKSFFQRYEAAKRRLEKMTRLWNAVKRQFRKTGRMPQNHRLIEEAYYEALEQVAELSREYLRRAPDGTLVKRHLDAFLKRFDRRFGQKVLARVPDRETAEALAEHYQEEGTYPMVKVLSSKKGGYEVVAVLYRVLWWMEFQRRGAPHLHFMFFDVAEIDMDEVRRWAGQAWAGVVWGLRSLARYLSAEVGQAYDTLRALWGKEAGEAFFAEWLAARGLDFEVWKHLRAGTRVERMRKEHWGYVNKEVVGGAAKAYQRRVPKLYRNVGRWWGYRNYRRQKPKRVEIPMSDPRAAGILLDALKHAAALIPKPAFKFRQKLERSVEAIKNSEPYAYLTLWGEAGSLALKKVEAALAA